MKAKLIFENESLAYKQLMILGAISLLEIELLDELQPNTPKMKEHKENLIAFHEELIKEIVDTYTIQRGTYFNELSTKIDTVIRKNFNNEM